MPRLDLVRERLKAHLDAGGVVLGEGAGVHGALTGLNATMSPMSEGATVAMATGMALAGRAVVVELLDPQALVRAGDALADLADLAGRSEGAYRPTVVIRVPGGTEVRHVRIPVYIAGRGSDVAEQLSAALVAGGVTVLVDDSHQAAPGDLAPADLGVPVVLQEGTAVTVLASGADIVSALAGAQLAAAEGVSCLVVEVRGPGAIAGPVTRTGRLVVLGDIAVLPALNSAFWSLEAPWESLPRGASASQVRDAVHTVLGA